MPSFAAARMTRFATVSLSVLALLATGVPLAPALAQQAAAPAAASAHDALLALFRDSDEANLRRNPFNALFRGDLRYADRFGDFMSDAYFDGERAAGQDDLRRLHAIDRARLDATDQLAYDVFEWQTKAALKALDPAVLAVTRLLPLDHMSGFQVYYPSFASGQGAAPFKTLADYDNNLKRHREYVVFIDRAIAKFREGMKAHVVQPKLVVTNMIDQLDALLAEGVEGSTFYGPAKTFPDAIPEADRVRLRGEYAAMVRDQLTPVHTRLRDFLKNEYLPAARDTVGLSELPGGAALYRLYVEQSTTLPLDPEAVHKLGLSEVARIKGGMDAIRKQTGFKGDLQQFFEFLRSDPRFRPATREALRDGYTAIGKRVDARVREQFALMPKTQMEIRPVEPFREKSAAAGSYEQGTPDGARPGVFYYSAYDLPSRSTWGMETLYLHEGIPGHHFQISLAQENEALPAFMRFGGNTAFVEGWALYAETLAQDLGMETDPYQRFGGLNDEMLRAMRLVVDTGIHAKHWTRDQAIKYMLDNSSMSRTDATVEVERYIAIPSQALAYKIGALTILRLKAKAQKELGTRFDPRAFHAQVLDTGALPMTVLEAKIERWIAASKAAPGARR